MVKNKTKTRRRRVPGRRRSISRHQKLFWNRQADALLAHAESIWAQTEHFDTAVRDSIAQGLAYVVNAAFDCRAIAMKFETLDAWSQYIDNSTAEWFRNRGFVDWFCGAAATLFRTTPPRTLAPVVLVKQHRKRR
jgi:hypothetical protein